MRKKMCTSNSMLFVSIEYFRNKLQHLIVTLWLRVSPKCIICSDIL